MAISLVMLASVPQAQALSLDGTASLPSASPAPWPPAINQALKAAGLPQSSLSAWVQPVDQRTPRLAIAPDTPRQMASVMKLLTTGVALRTLGPAFSWETWTALSGPLDANGVLHGDVLIKASGDPSLDGMRLNAALQQWREAGLREIQGDVRVDRSVMSLAPHDPAAFDHQALKPYNAGADAFLLAHGAVSLMWRIDTSRPGWAQLSLNPPLAGVQLDAQVKLAPASVPCGAWREALSLQVSGAPAVAEGQALPPRTLQVRGTYPSACGNQGWPILWPQAQALEHSARTWQAAWQQLGGSLKGVVRDGVWPAGTVPWVKWTSPPLAEVIRDINKYSNNVMARQLFLTLGRGDDGAPATIERARSVVTSHVRDATRRPGEHNSPCDGRDALVLDNGAGLSRTEATTTRCLARWIELMWADPLMPEWLASLPVAGVDGTAKRMVNAVGRAHLKTGSLDDATALAGVVQDEAGQRLIVIAVVNDPKAEAARPVLQAVLGWAAASQSTAAPGSAP